MSAKKDKKVPSVLFADDDREATDALVRGIKRRKVSFDAFQAYNSTDALSIQENNYPEVGVIDLSIDPKIGPDSGLELIANLIENDPSIRIIVLTGHGGEQFGIQAIHRGAASFLQKPINTDHLLALINDAISYSDLKRKYKELSVSHESFQSIPGLKSANAEMIEVIEKAAFAASNSLPVLILGETGTGKGVLANAIATIQRHHQKRFISFYPSFVSQDLVNSELFGHQKGAFTGATEQRIGLIEEAHQGVLFIDEVADLPKETQLSLLRVLQEKKFRRVGANKEIDSDFRLICATNQNIEKLIKEEKFRADFYHRVAHIELHIPPLRERKEDIPFLAEIFLRNIITKENLAISGFSNQAISKLCNYDWPGNIRELQASVENSIFHACYEKRRFVEAEDIQTSKKKKSSPESSLLSFRQRVKNFEIKLIQDALAKNENNQSKAAKALQLDRTSLRRILDQSK